MNTSEEFGLIPLTAKVLAAVVFIAGVALFTVFFGAGHFTLMTAVGTFAGAILAGFILLAGYVYADARRRGMPAAAWTALALLIPNAVGFVLYFLLRKPLVHPCPTCGQPVATGFAFCPACGQPQTAAPNHGSV
jgi:hypothetical protein